MVQQVDVANANQVRDLQRRVEAEIGPVDILVNNAGVVPFLVSDEYVPENLQRLVNVNILANFYVSNNNWKICLILQTSVTIFRP